MTAAPAGSVVALDVGGTSIKGARFSARGASLQRAVVPSGTGGAALDAALELVRHLAAPDTRAVGLAAPGLVDAASGTVRYAANLGWRDVPLAGLVEERCGLPASVQQDVSAAGRAEAAARGSADDEVLLLVMLGTGVGASVVVGGRPLPGAAGMAAELGHLQARPDGEQCTCGQRGCVEVYASASAVTRRYASAVGRPVASAEEVVARLACEPAARHVWNEACEVLGGALASATLLLDPAVVVLGGGLARAGERLLTPVRAATAARLAWRRPPPVVPSAIGDDVGVVGAALGAWDRTGWGVPDAWRGAARTHPS
ncbi:glucokinase [Motilibacter rhizosphaerae]|uniref:Glucokinase n=1 Tax=Motilibacter rhizosphaerae TaxID=598652 RepID=A0A4Q7NXJ9_9ACTN|nr:ROK family protein [Motilibacter rhizosphaerae]RZS91730.1 glucokinase [Motilibacter rhizosphaerae]